MKCPNRNLEEYKQLENLYGENLAHFYWDLYDEKIPDEIINKRKEEVSFSLKIVNSLLTDKAIQIFNKAKKHNWEDWRFWEGIGVPKNQQTLVSKSYTEYDNPKDIATEILANYSYTIEVETTQVADSRINFNDASFFLDGEYYHYVVGEGMNSEGDYESYINYYKSGKEIARQEYNKAFNERTNIKSNTQYYSNLTVPGGTNYTENEIKTPQITPSIKGHAQFSTDQGIGWFRSDETLSKTTHKDLKRVWDRTTNTEVVIDPNPKTRRILEVQSDLFQKGRDKEALALEHQGPNFSRSWRVEGLPIDEEKPWVIRDDDGDIHDFYPTREAAEQALGRIAAKKESQFLQLLNKDNNWVTFFIKSIIQDSAKKGYEKVLFPSGNTASKVEGHTTLEEFKKEKERRLNSIEKTISSLRNAEIRPIARTTKDIFERQRYSAATEAGTFYDYSIEELKETLNNTADEFGIERDQIVLELERIDKEGFAALRPIFNFYQNTVKNILKKNYKINEVTDEYGNTWFEVNLDNTSTNPISLKIQEEASEYSNSDIEEVFELVDYDFENANPRQILENIIKNGTIKGVTERELVLAKYFLHNLDKNETLNINFKQEAFTAEDSDGDYEGSVPFMQFNPNTNTIVMSQENSAEFPYGVFIKSFLHELFHSFTNYPFHKHPARRDALEREFVNEVTKLYKEALENTENPSMYGFTNVLEFVSEIMTNPDFIEENKFIRLNILQRFIELLRRLWNKLMPSVVNISRPKDNIYDEAKSLIIDYIDSIEKVRPFNNLAKRSGSLPISNAKASKKSKPVFSEELKKDINDLRQHLISRIQELKAVSGSKDPLVNKRLDTIKANLERVAKQANYEVIISTAISEIEAVNKLLENTTAEKLHESLKVLEFYKDLHTYITGREISDDQKAKVDALQTKISAARNTYNKLEKEFLFEKAKSQGFTGTKDQLFKSTEDITGWTKGMLTPRQTDNPLANLMYDVLRSMKRRIHDLWTDVDKRAKEIRKNLPNNWMNTIFDTSGDLITPIDSRYFTEEQNMLENTGKIIESFYQNTGATKAQRNSAYQQRFVWYRDNNKFYYSKENEERYLQDEADARANFTDSDGNLDVSAFTDWVYENKPLTGKLNENTREISLKGVDKVYRNGKRVNSGWMKYLDTVPNEEYKNPKYEDVKDLDYYKFLVDLMMEGISKMPKESLKDETAYFRYLSNIRLDLTDNKFSLTETWSGMKDTFQDWFTMNITALDRKMMRNAVLDEKGVRKPSIRLKTLTNIKDEELVKDPFELILNFYKGALAFEQKVQAEPAVILLQHAIENLPAVSTGVTGKMFETVLSTSETHPELVKQGLVNLSTQTKYQIQADLYGKIRNDNPKVKLSPLEEKELQEKTAEWIKNGMIGEPPTVRKITVDKLFDSVVDYTRILKLGGNIYSGITNLLMGLSSNYIYAARNKEFSAEDLDWGTGLLFKSVLKFWTFNQDQFVTEDAKKIANLAIKFGITENVYEGQDEKRAPLLKKAVEILFIPQSSGEYLIHSQLMLAMLRSTKIKDLKGNERKLWEAFDSEGEFKTAEFGNNPEWTKQEVLSTEGINVSKIKKFEDDLHDLRIRTQGDYTNSLLAKSKWQARVLMLFRTWLPKALDERFGSQRGDDFKGRYRSYNDIADQISDRYNLLGMNIPTGLLKIIGLSLSGLVLKVINLPFGIGKYTGLKAVSNSGIEKIEEYFRQKEVQELDIENMRANIKELQMTVYFYSVAAMLAGAGDDDDFAYNYFGNVGYRLYQDLTFFYNPNSFMSIIKDPIPVVSTLFDVGAFISAAGVLISDPKRDRIRRGTWRGDSRTLHNLAKITPVWRQFNTTYSLMKQIFGSDSWKYTKK